MWLDLRNGLPFRDQSVDRIYSCHVFEHFYIDELKQILKECKRVLKAEGGIRILVPSLEQAISVYVSGRKDLFSDFPDSYCSIGGRFFNYVFCDSQHRVAFDFSFLTELLQEVGYRNVFRSESRKSVLFPVGLLSNFENINEEYIHSSLIVEAFPK